MPAVIAAILGWLARVIVPLFGLSRLFGFFKQLLGFGLMTVGLPLAINWGAFKVAQATAPSIFAHLGLTSHTVALTGLAAWLANQLSLPFCITVFMGFVAQAAVMKLVKFGGIFSRFRTDRYS